MQPAALKALPRPEIGPGPRFANGPCEMELCLGDSGFEMARHKRETG